MYVALVLTCWSRLGNLLVIAEVAYHSAQAETVSLAPVQRLLEPSFWSEGGMCS